MNDFHRIAHYFKQESQGFEEIAPRNSEALNLRDTQGAGLDMREKRKGGRFQRVDAKSGIMDVRQRESAASGATILTLPRDTPIYISRL